MEVSGHAESGDSEGKGAPEGSGSAVDAKWVVQELAYAIDDIEEICGEFSVEQKHAAHEVLLRTAATISAESSPTPLEEIYKTLQKARVLVIADWTRRALEADEEDPDGWRHQGGAPSPAG